MRIRRIALTVFLALVAGSAPARADETSLVSLTAQLTDASERAADTLAAPFTLEARTARIAALGPAFATSLAEVKVAASEAVSDFIRVDVAARLVGREPLDLTLVPGVAFRMETSSDVVRLRELAPMWRDAVSAAAAVSTFEFERFRVCPLKGWHWFTDTWGDGREGTRTHKGTDLISLLGMKLYAMETGRIIQMNWHWAGGRTMYLLGETSGDVYYYAHMDGYARDLGLGSRVRAGRHLGWVGLTGNADTAHLHLGWMPGADGVDFDRLTNPYYLLADLCR